MIFKILTFILAGWLIILEKKYEKANSDILDLECRLDDLLSEKYKLEGKLNYTDIEKMELENKIIDLENNVEFLTNNLSVAKRKKLGL